MRIGHLVLFLVLNLIGQLAICQQENEAEVVLKMIQELQVESDDFYDAGLFPSKRYWFNSSDPVEDNNVFVTASIAYILRSISSKVDPESSSIIRGILDKAASNYHKYYSRRGVPTYNFWQTIGPDLPFPNGGSLLSKEAYRLPDDYDDTSMIMLASDQDSLRDLEVRNRMVSYANRPDREPVPNTLKKYKNHMAYEVFYVDKMDQEYDIVVMCNTLLFVLDRGYELEAIDLKTIDFIKQVLHENDHWEHPEYISRSYRTTIWILYHIARLISVDPKLFGDMKKKVTADLHKINNRNLSDMERLLVYTSLIRLAEQPEVIITFEEVQDELDSFVFFHAQLSDFGWVPTMKWRSRAFNLALFYEYLVLSR